MASSSSSVPLLERIYAWCFDPGGIDIARRGEPGDEVVSQASPASREWLARETRDEAIASTSEMSPDLKLAAPVH